MANPLHSLTLPESGYDVVGSIVLYNTAANEIAQSIRQFLAAPLHSHLCIIDNSPQPLEIPSIDPLRVSYLRPGANLGYGTAHNIALRAANGRSRYSVVMNTDIDYEADVIPRLIAFLDQHANAGMAAPKILNPDGSLQYVCRMLPTPKNFFLRRFLPDSAWAKRVDHDYELRFWDHNSVANLPYFQGSYMMLRTELVNRLGGFDERFFMYGEDIDLTRRIHQVAEALYVPDVTITHEYRRMSSRGWKGTWIGIQNNCRYFNKWGWFIDGERRALNRSIRHLLG